MAKGEANLAIGRVMQMIKHFPFYPLTDIRHSRKYHYSVVIFKKHVKYMKALKLITKDQIPLT